LLQLLLLLLQLHFSIIMSTPTSGTTSSSPSDDAADPNKSPDDGDDGTNRANRKRKGRAKGAIGWKEPEWDCLLDLVDTILPVGSKQWELVAAGHANNYPAHKRTGDGCKKQFNRLSRCEKPTGTNLIPRQVVRAKEIQEKIDREEVMGYAALNDTDEEASNGSQDDDAIDTFANTEATARKQLRKALEGTRLLDKDESSRSRRKHPVRMLFPHSEHCLRCVKD